MSKSFADSESDLMHSKTFAKLRKSRQFFLQNKMRDDPVSID